MAVLFMDHFTLHLFMLKLSCMHLDRQGGSGSQSHSFLCVILIIVCAGVICKDEWCLGGLAV